VVLALRKRRWLVFEISFNASPLSATDLARVVQFFRVRRSRSWMVIVVAKRASEGDAEKGNAGLDE
jgi:hypothetical protein